MYVGPFFLDVIYSATYTPGEGCLDGDLDLSIEEIHPVYGDCDPDIDAGPYLSEQAINIIDAKCEEDFNENMHKFRAQQREEYMADQYATNQLYREVE